MGDRGLAWAITMPEGNGPLVYAVVGGTIFGRAPGDIWMGTDYGEGTAADAAIRTAMSIQESEGAKLFAGPTEFDIPEGISDGGGLMAQQIGAAAESALMLGIAVPAPEITFGPQPPTTAAPGDMYFETDANELRIWDGKLWLRVEAGS